MSTINKNTRPGRARQEQAKQAIVSTVLEKKKKVSTRVVDLSLKTEIAKKAKAPTQQAKLNSTPEYLISPTTATLRPFKEAALRLQQKKKSEAVRSRKDTQAFLAKAPRKGKKYSLDLRINSSYTAGYFQRGGMAPGPALSRLTRAKDVDIICLTNFYCVSHLDVVANIDPKSKISCLPGLDLCCQVGICKEVRFVALFAENFSKEALTQVLADLNVPEQAQGNENYRLDCSCAQMLEVVEAAGGVLIPTAVDRTPYQELAIPSLVEEFGFHVFDLVSPENPEIFKKWPGGEFTFFGFSNALSLAQIGARENVAKLEEPGFEGIKKLVQRRK